MLKQHDRVCKFYIDCVPNALLGELGRTSEPFPALTELDLVAFEDDPRILPDSFLGGFVPSLQSFSLWGIPFPTMRKLLLSTRDLVILSLGFIPPSGFILPDAMVDILSTLTKLKTFHLNFDHFVHTQFWAQGAGQRPPSLARVVLPALTNFDFYGNTKYLEGIVSRVDAPLDRIVTTLDNQLAVCNIPLLHDFIRRTKISNRPHRADIFFSSVDVEISLFQRKGDINVKALNLRFPCSPYEVDSQLSSLAQVCGILLPPLPSLEQLGIYNLKLCHHNHGGGMRMTTSDGWNFYAHSPL
jgi:hypothetical protein